MVANSIECKVQSTMFMSLACMQKFRCTYIHVRIFVGTKFLMEQTIPNVHSISSLRLAISFQLQLQLLHIYKAIIFRI